MLFNLPSASSVILCPLVVLEAGLDAVSPDEFDVSFANCGMEGHRRPEEEQEGRIHRRKWTTSFGKMYIA